MTSYNKEDEINLMEKRLKFITTYTQNNEKNLRTYTGGITLIGFLIKKHPKKDIPFTDEKRNQKILTSQGFDVFLGNVQQSAIKKDLLINKNGINIEVSPPKVKNDQSQNNQQYNQQQYNPQQQQQQQYNPQQHNQQLQQYNPQQHNQQQQNQQQQNQQQQFESQNLYGFTDNQINEIYDDINNSTDIPKYYKLYSWTTQRFSTLSDDINSVREFEMISLNGIKAKALTPTGKYTEYGIFLNVASIERYSNISLLDLYHIESFSEIFSNTWLSKCTDEYLEQENRYDRNNIIVINVNQPIDLAKSWEEKYIVIYQPKIPDPNGIALWTRKSIKNEILIHANLSFSIQQWKEGGYTEDNHTIENYKVDVTIFSETLEQFGITDISAWQSIAPNIFQFLNYRIIGNIDLQTTKNNWGGINPIKNECYNAALSLVASCIFADISSVYKKIGIPVTHTWVMKYYENEIGIEIEKQNINLLHFIPPSIVSMDNTSIDVKKKLLLTPEVEFRILLELEISDYIGERLQILKPEEGDELMKCLAIDKLKDSDKIYKKDHIIYELISGLKRSNQRKFIFALTDIFQLMKTKKSISNIQEQRIHKLLTGKNMQQNYNQLQITGSSNDSGYASELTENGNNDNEKKRNYGQIEVDDYGNKKNLSINNEKSNQNINDDTSKQISTTKSPKKKKSKKSGNFFLNYLLIINFF